MRQGLSEIITIHDESMTVKDCVKQACKAYRGFLAQQKKLEGELRVTGVAFGREFRTIFENVDVKKCKISDGDYVPSGVSTVLDAVANTMEKVGIRYCCIEESERPENVILLITAFGRDSGSRANTYDMIADRIIHQTKYYNWHIFVLSDSDYIPKRLKMPEENTFIVDFDEKKSFEKVFARFSDKVAEIRKLRRSE